MVGYLVNGKFFFNIYLAFLEASSSNTSVHFYYHDSDFDKINWTIEPVESIEALMDRRAFQLSLKYDKLIFLYSGGYDSQTIFNVLNRNKIKVAEFIILTSDSVSWCSKDIINFARVNWWDSNATFTEWGREKEELLQDVFDSEDWLYKNLGLCHAYSATIPGRGQMRYVERKYENQHYGIIIGLEKPIVEFREGAWFATKLDKHFSPSMGYANLESFFCSPDLPELDVKQCHMLKRAIEQEFNSNVPDNYISTEWQSNAKRSVPNRKIYDVNQYHKHAVACGRHTEAMFGYSARQKIAAARTKLIIHPDQVNKSIEFGETSNITDLFIRRFHDKSPSVTNYVRGYYALNLDTKLRNSIPLHKCNDIRSVVGLWAKKYRMTKH